MDRFIDTDRQTKKINRQGQWTLDRQLQIYVERQTD